MTPLAVVFAVVVGVVIAAYLRPLLTLSSALLPPTTDPRFNSSLIVVVPRRVGSSYAEWLAERLSERDWAIVLGQVLRSGVWLLTRDPSLAVMR
jgi:hypothetical protein